MVHLSLEHFHIDWRSMNIVAKRVEKKNHWNGDKKPVCPTNMKNIVTIFHWELINNHKIEAHYCDGCRYSLFLLLLCLFQLTRQIKFFLLSLFIIYTGIQSLHRVFVYSNKKKKNESCLRSTHRIKFHDLLSLCRSNNDIESERKKKTLKSERLHCA